MQHTIDYLHRRLAELERRVARLEEQATENKNASGWWSYFFASPQPPKYSLT